MRVSFCFFRLDRDATAWLDYKRAYMSYASVGLFRYSDAVAFVSRFGAPYFRFKGSTRK